VKILQISGGKKEEKKDWRQLHCIIIRDLYL